jgi:nicotine oxidoreductase
MHLVLHATYKAGLFLAAGSVLHAMGDQQDFRRFGGLVKILPLTYTVILIASLSLAAFPWLSGFYSKDVRDKCLLIVGCITPNHFSFMIITPELIIKASFITNIASLIFILKVNNIINLNHYILTWVISSMIKTELFEAHYSLASTVGHSLVRDGTFGIVNNLSLWLLTREISTGWVRNSLKNKNERSEEDMRIKKTIVGFPKIWKNMGDRVIILPRLNKGRITVNNIFQFRCYNTGSISQKSDIIDKLNSLYKRSKDMPNLVIDRNLYNLISSVDILKLAYENLKSKPGNLTPGIKPETLDGISIEKLEKLSEKLKSEKFQFSAGRRIYIPKSGKSNKTRPLMIAPPLDKLVQEGIRLILNAIYEPIFLESSHGFRPNKSCHTALKYINQKFQGCNWLIEGDISKCFDSIDHHKLMNLVETKIKDRKFTRLIWKSIRAGHFEFKIYQANIAGTPQGSIISPILANIYLHQFDCFIKKLQENFNIGKENRRLPSYNKLDYEMNKAKKNGDMKLVLKLAKEKRKLPYANFSDPSYKCLCYVRYADDWIIGVKGTTKEVKEIRDLVKLYLSNLKLELNETKTKITNVNSDYASFLGVKIIRAKHVKYIRISKTSSIKRNPRRLRLLAPLVSIIKKLSEAGFMSKGKSSPKYVWMHLDHPEILYLYNSIVRGYLNYYSFVNNFGNLTSTIIHILKSSCAKLLATKFSLKTQAKVYQKFGKNLTYEYRKNGKVKKVSFIEVEYKTTLKFLINDTPVINNLYGYKSITTLENLSCSTCGSTYRVEMHHVRKLKDLNPKLSLVNKLMIKKKRKQIALCRECHMNLHRRK